MHANTQDFTCSEFPLNIPCATNVSVSHGGLMQRKRNRSLRDSTAVPFCCIHMQANTQDFTCSEFPLNIPCATNVSVSHGGLMQRKRNRSLRDSTAVPFCCIQMQANTQDFTCSEFPLNIPGATHVSVSPGGLR